MKFPYKAVCVDASDFPKYLTQGKIYTVIQGDHKYIMIEKDDRPEGLRTEWFSWRFAPAPLTPFEILDELPIG